jgi:hypothetical protein
MTIPAPAPAVRHFTVAEANRTLPLLRMIVQDIVELFGDLQRRRERLKSLRSRQGQRNRGADDPYEEEILQMEAELETDAERLQAFADELHQIGVELKDPAVGLVDFRTTINGREACLCWRLGEEEIRHWHELDAGFSGRQSLADVASSVEPYDVDDADSERN